MAKRFAAVILSVLFACALFGASSSALLGTDNHWAGEYALALNKMGIFYGDDLGYAHLDDNIKRAEFLALLIRTMYDEKDIPEGGKSFADVKFGSWYYDIASFAKQKGIVLGDDLGNLEPQSPITREHIVLMLTRALELRPKKDAKVSFKDITEDYMYYDELWAAVSNNLISGYDDGTFGPKRYATRGETAAMIGRMMGVEVEIPAPPAKGQYYNLTWDHLYSKDVKSPGTGMTGLNVVSPTWFRVRSLDADEKPKSYEYKLAGNNNYYLQDIANHEYVENAHSQGMEVWALFKSNDFSANNNSRFLNDIDAVDSAVAQMREMIIKYKLDGINMDFENILPSDKDAYTALVAKMYKVTQELGAVLSVDVTKYEPTGGPWSLGYDRAALAENSDYIMLMAYDQNGTFSSKAGSVGDMPWVENSILLTLKEVPAEKLILGVPFYTRLWQSQNGKVIKSSAIGFDTAMNRVREAGAEILYDERTGQNYATWVKDGVTFEIWLEDETSMKNRINLIKKYNLAGLASWSKGFANNEIWGIIHENLN